MLIELLAIGCVLWVLVVFMDLIPNKRTRDLAKQVPGPKGLPLLGVALEFGTNSHDIYTNFNRLAEEHGNIFGAWLGNKLFYIISNAMDTEVILGSSKHVEKSWLYKFIGPWLGSGLITGKGAKWQSHRKILTPAFHFSILGEFLETFQRNTSILIERLRSEVNKPNIDIYPFVSLCSLDNICEAAMGIHINAQTDLTSEYVSCMKQLSEIIHHRMFKPWLFNDVLFGMSSLGSLQDRCLKVVHGFANKVIETRKTELFQSGTDENEKVENDIGQKKRLAFLSTLLKYAKDGAALTDADIREEVDTFMMAGHGTTSACITFALHLLSHHQDVQEKVFQEIQGILGTSDRVPQYQDLQDMKYLEQVIKETLRLYPSVPFIGRNITEEVQLKSGYILPVGSSATVLIFRMHRDPDIYPEPDRFNPDHFLPEASKNRPPFSYIPFSAGPRNCIGQRFAMLEMKAMLSSVLRQYKILPAENAPELWLEAELILRSGTGVHIKIADRHPEKL